MSKLQGPSPSNCLENWFKYRLPGGNEVFGGASHKLCDGIAKGFVIAPFRNPSEGLKTIPCSHPLEDCDLKPQKCHMPKSTSREEHRDEVEYIVASLNDNTGKTVASRVINVPLAIDLNATFNNLCESYPNAFVFMFSTPETGTWIGATPELLLQKEGNQVSTMALAGTRIAGQNAEWDIKNLEEQRMVTDFITDKLSPYCKSIKISQPYTRQAGTVEHICTDITATLASHSSDENNGNQIPLNALSDILCDLSPTPAACGSDRESSMHIIEEKEKHGREMYGGFCGPCFLNGVTEFYVNLRSAKCNENEVCVFAGGGITRMSDPESEWQETEMKSKTIINQLSKQSNCKIQ